MASFSRYETNGFEIFRLGSHTYPSRGPQKNLARLYTLTPDINSSHLIFYKAIMALDAHATYSSPSVTSVISLTTSWGSRMPPFFCTMTDVFIVTPPGSFCGHSKWCANSTSRCRMATMSLSCFPGEKVPSQCTVKLSFTDSHLERQTPHHYISFLCPWGKLYLGFYVKSIRLTRKLSMAPSVSSVLYFSLS